MKIAMVLMSLFLLVSCGDNTTSSSSGSTSSAVTDGSYNPVTTYQYVYNVSDFIEKVSSGQFMAPGSDNYNFFMSDLSVSCGSNSFLNFFNTTSISMYSRGTFLRSIQSGTPRYYFSADSGLVTSYGTILQGLIDIINDSSIYSALRVHNAAYQFTTSDGAVYIIDLNYPLIANPVQAYDCDSGDGFKINYHFAY